MRIGRAWPGETLEETTARLRSDEQEEVAPDPAEIRRMAGVLAQAAPSLTRQDVPKGWMLVHGGSGAQIRMSGDEFTMSVPRLFSPTMARPTWMDLWPAIRALSAEGYSVYAPPLSRLLDPETDLEAVVATYSAAAPAAAAASGEVNPTKPWWQFWR
jgi:hypothetical protein